MATLLGKNISLPSSPSCVHVFLNLHQCFEALFFVSVFRLCIVDSLFSIKYKASIARSLLRLRAFFFSAILRMKSNLNLVLFIDSLLLVTDRLEKGFSYDYSLYLEFPGESCIIMSLHGRL